MKNDSFFELFSYLSKAIIIIPIVAVIIALIFKLNTKDKPNAKILVPPTLKLAPQSKHKKSAIKLDLKGPFICGGEINDASASAYIKDKKIRVIYDQKSEIDNLIVLGDCYYKWEDGEYSGDKICGIGPMVSLAETMIDLGGVGFETLFKQLSDFSFNKKTAVDKAIITNLVNSCRKEEIDDKIFNLPSNILFKNNQ